MFSPEGPRRCSCRMQGVGVDVPCLALPALDSYLHICTSAHLLLAHSHIPTFVHLHICLHMCHLHIPTSAHLYICTFAISTFSHLQVAPTSHSIGVTVAS